jgi:hypothetical protein
MPGVTTRIKSITSCIIEGVNSGHKFTADELGSIVENLVEEYDLDYFTEHYDSRPKYTKGVTQVEYQMKKLELEGIVERCGVREWVKL